MKSKVKIPGPVDFRTMEYLKGSSFNFLENERVINVIQRQIVDPATKEQKANITEQQEQPQLKEKTNEMMESKEVLVEDRLETSGKYPKRYVTTCYLQPKQIPVKYSETMILKIGSTKKRYFESVYYETKLSPNRWTETMSMIVPIQRTYDCKSEIQIPLQEEECYIPLPQAENGTPNGNHATFISYV